MFPELHFNMSSLKSKKEKKRRLVAINKIKKIKEGKVRSNLDIYTSLDLIFLGADAPRTPISTFRT